jgi:HEAT repeat protein
MNVSRGVSQRLVPPLASSLLSLAVLLAGWGSLAAEPFPPDPVEALKQVLGTPFLDRKELSEELGKAIARIQSIADLSRALALQEWPQQETRDPMDEARLESQVLLAGRLEQRLRQLLKSGSTASQLAALTLIADIGTRISVPENPNQRNLNKLSEGLTGAAPRPTATRKALGRVMTADVANLVTKGENERVRETAARTLGQIFPDPRQAVATLRPLLHSEQVTERRAAADGLLSMVREVSRLAAAAGATSTEVRIDVTAADWADTCSQVIMAASVALGDTDIEVRRLAALALERTAAGLIDQARPERPEPTAERRGAARSGPSHDLQPVIEAFGNRETADALARAVLDADARVRISVRRVLEGIGSVRDRHQHPESAPRGTYTPGSEETNRLNIRSDTVLASANGQERTAPADPILDTLRKAFPALRKGVSDPVAAARLQAVEALETMGPAAGPAVPELIQALRDPNLLVRWAAARALGKIGPEQAAAAVGPLGRLLFDPDLDVDLAAATALERFGPLARGAVPQLVRALGASDEQKRLAVIRTLTSIGTDAAPAIPALAVALSDPETMVRRQAAELLGKFGSAAASAEPALRRAMADLEPEVRQAASAALLKILHPGQAS